MKYIRIKGDVWGFVSDEIHQINRDDIAVCDDDYMQFLRLQEDGFSFELRRTRYGNIFFRPLTADKNVHLGSSGYPFASLNAVSTLSSDGVYLNEDAAVSAIEINDHSEEIRQLKVDSN